MDKFLKFIATFTSLAMVMTLITSKLVYADDASLQVEAEEASKDAEVDSSEVILVEDDYINNVSEAEALVTGNNACPKNMENQINSETEYSETEVNELIESGEVSDLVEDVDEEISENDIDAEDIPETEVLEASLESEFTDVLTDFAEIEESEIDSIVGEIADSSIMSKNEINNFLKLKKKSGNNKKAYFMYYLSKLGKKSLQKVSDQLEEVDQEDVPVVNDFVEKLYANDHILYGMQAMNKSDIKKSLQDLEKGKSLDDSSSAKKALKLFKSKAETKWGKMNEKKKIQVLKNEHKRRVAKNIMVEKALEEGADASTPMLKQLFNNAQEMRKMMPRGNDCKPNVKLVKLGFRVGQNGKMGLNQMLRDKNEQKMIFKQAVREIGGMGFVKDPKRLMNADGRKIDQAERKINQAERKINQAERIENQAERKINQAERIENQAERKIDQAERKENQAERKIDQAERKVDQAERKINQAERIENQAEKINNFAEKLKK